MKVFGDGAECMAKKCTRATLRDGCGWRWRAGGASMRWRRRACESSGQAKALFVAVALASAAHGRRERVGRSSASHYRDYLLSGCTEAGAAGEVGSGRSVRVVTPLWRRRSGCRISVWVASLTRGPKGCTFFSLSGWIGSTLVSRFLFPIRLRGPDVTWALVNEVPRASNRPAGFHACCCVVPEYPPLYRSILTLHFSRGSIYEPCHTFHLLGGRCWSRRWRRKRQRAGSGNDVQGHQAVGHDRADVRSSAL